MMRKGVCSPFNHLLISHPNPRRLGFSFRWERTVMATSTMKTCYTRLIGRLTYLNQKPRASSLACGCSTMHQAIKSGLKMVCLLEKCPRTPTKAGLMSRIVMDTADFGTHLAAGRWRSKVLSLSSNCVEV